MKKVICFIFSLSILVFCFNFNAFADNIDRDYELLKALEIMVGDENGDMRFEDNVTRAEFTKVATSISNFRKLIPESQKTSPFGDVPYKHWATPFIRAGVDNGIITGYPDSTFRPNNNVNFEEALTILLKILGYSDSDFGDVYPYGQYSLAKNIELTEYLDVELGDILTRRQVADLILNALNIQFKNSSLTPLNNFDVQKYEDVVLISTNKEDASIDRDKILTSVGTFKFSEDLSKFIGNTGYILVKDNEKIVYFNSDTNKNNIDKFVIYSTVSDGVVIYNNGEFSQIKISDNIVTYYDNKLTTFGTIKSVLSMGDTIYVNKNFKNEIDNVIIYKGELEGPFVYENEISLSSRGISEYFILKNGKTVTKNEIDVYDVFYYSSDLNLIMVYNDKVTGVYKTALPNQDSPITVEISGVNYEIESVDAFKSLSSAGTFKYGDKITVLLGSDRRIVSVLGVDEYVNKNTEDFVIYTTLADSLVIFKNKEFSQIKIPNDTLSYYEGKQTTFSAIKSSLSMGDTIYINKDYNNEIDYVTINKGELEGPFVYKDVTSFNLVEASNYLILKNGNIIESTDLEKYDVFYYSEDLGIILVYNDKITGVYKSAFPNQELPITVEVSGVTYEIEGMDAFKTLSSTGLYKYGDKITLLLGLDGKIAAVIGINDYESKNIGYLIDSGIKTYITDTNKQESDYYITVVTPDGVSKEYRAKRNYSSFKNSIVEVGFDGELAVVTRINNSKYNLSLTGIVNYENLMCGTFLFSNKVDILDVGTTTSWEVAKYTTVSLQRLDGVKLTADSVLYYETNERNAITKLILTNVTNDYYEYGIVTSVNKQNESLFATYKYNLVGTSNVLQTQNIIYGVNVGPAKFGIVGGQITFMQNLTKLNSTISEITRNSVIVGQNHYLLDDNIKIFYKNAEYDYMLITLDDFIDNIESYKIDGVYYDKSMSSGGRVRVICISDKRK